MSLLIKALNKAEEAQAEHAKTEQAQAAKGKAKAESGLELSLSPSKFEESVAVPATVISAATSNTNLSSSQASQKSKAIAASTSAGTSTSATSAAAKSAANVFTSKGIDVSKKNSALALIAGAGLIALLGMGFYYYQFANTPDVVIPPRPLEVAQTQPQALPEASAALPVPELPVTETPAPQVPTADNEALPVETQAVEMQQAPTKKMTKNPSASEAVELADNEEVIVAANEMVVDETLAVTKKRGKSKKSQSGESIASRSASIDVIKSKSEAAGVNPVLMSAYEAYNAGDDAKAQKLYKQVLQRDLRNIDALQGLGAIASRQGRDADASAWFSKVLELDPRNSMAQAALLDNQPQGNEANSETRIKNMLAKHPDDANLHVALGNLYAEQNQWPAAQQAYFDAYSLNASADNAFNLAVSLDQMGKPKLALPYYRRALEQASSTSNIDKAALEARITAIQ